MQYIAFLTIVRKELVRILRIWPQTILPPVITQTLYFIIFGGLIGANLGSVAGGEYIAFLVPGMILMAVITNSYANVSTSFFGAKFGRSIEELLVAPVHPLTIILGYTIGGVLRGLLVAIVIYMVSFAFYPHGFDHPVMGLVVLILVSLFFSVLGLINALYADNFDQVNIIPTFFLTPLTYLGGVFYPVSQLTGIWHTLSVYNPITWMVDSFRYSYTGVTSLSPYVTLMILLIFSVCSCGIAYFLLRKRKVAL